MEKERKHSDRVKESVARDIHQDVKAIRGALLGDEFNPEGLIHKVDKNTRKLDTLTNERDMAMKGVKIVGGLFGAGGAFWFLWEKIKHLFA